MRTTVLLADAAQTDAAGKAHALGIGWSVTSTPTPPAAIVAVIEVEWGETNERHTLDFELVDEDGGAVTALLPDGTSEPVRFHMDYEFGRPPGMVQGSPLTVPLTFAVGPGLQLQPGRRYRWKVTNSGQPGEDPGVSFYVRPTNT